MVAHHVIAGGCDHCIAKLPPFRGGGALTGSNHQVGDKNRCRAGRCDSRVFTRLGLFCAENGLLALDSAPVVLEFKVLVPAHRT